MTWLYILLAFLLLLFVILLSNVKISAKYDEELTLEIKYLFIKFKYRGSVPEPTTHPKYAFSL